jgi:capsular polysaccharide biosynthesis protein
MEIDLRIYITLFKKYLWLIVLLVFTSTTGAAIYSNYNYQPIYQASSKLIINNQPRADLLGKDPMNLASMAVNVTMINTYKEILKTPSIMEKVVLRHPDLNMSPEQLISKISITAINDTQLMAIIAIDSSHERAVRMANYVSETFQTEVPKVMKIDSNIAILDKAKEMDNPKPINQKSSRNIVLAAAASLVVAVCIILFLDSLDDTMKTVKEVCSVFDAPALAMIPKMKESKWKLRKRNKSEEKLGETSYAANNT